MAIYVNKGPIVFPKAGGEQYLTLEIDGAAHKDGKKVVEWKSIRTDASWLTIEYDEEQYEDGYYYGFTLNANTTTSIKERVARCYFDYVLEDGTSKSESCTVYQEGTSTIDVNCDNPLWFSSDNGDNPLSVWVTYKGVTNSNNIKLVSDTDYYFKVTPTAGWDEDGNYIIEYDIEPRYYNTSGLDNYGNVIFSYLNPTTSTEMSYNLHLTQNGCMYPFGLVKGDGSEVPTEKYMAQPEYKRWRDISFKQNTVYLKCYFPFGEGQANAKLETVTGGDDYVSLSINGDQLYGIEGFEEFYTITFKENFTTYTRRVDLKVTYTTVDGQEFTDTVQLFQNPSDGSNTNPQIISSINTIKYKSNGTPDMASNTAITINWVGNFDYKDFYTTADWCTLGEPTTVSSDGDYNVTYRYPITVENNTTDDPRTCELNFNGEANGEFIETVVTIIQARNNRQEYEEPDIPVQGDDYCGPIWKDVEYDFGNSEEVDYSIYTTQRVFVGGKYFDEDVLLFTGKTCRRPNSEHNTILVNKICQNYLETPILIEDAISNGNGYSVFKLTNIGGKVVYRTYRFVNDWSYTDDFKTGLLSHPILNDRTVVRSQKLPFTVFGAAEQVVVPYGIIYKNGITDDYGNPIENYENAVSEKNGLVTEFFPFERGGKDVVSYYIGDTEWTVVEDCKADFVLYYVNPWGGFDWFPIRGKVVETDNITQYLYTQNYNNTKWEFGKRRYLSEINKKYRLHTHWLREDESKRMWYLLQSNTVYLHNIKENKIYPVIITATEQEHKKRGITSNRISYQIDVELSQMRERM